MPSWTLRGWYCLQWYVSSSTFHAMSVYIKCVYDCTFKQTSMNVKQILVMGLMHSALILEEAFTVTVTLDTQEMGISA